LANPECPQGVKTRVRDGQLFRDVLKKLSWSKNR